MAIEDNYRTTLNPVPAEGAEAIAGIRSNRGLLNRFAAARSWIKASRNTTHGSTGSPWSWWRDKRSNATPCLN